MTEEQKAALHEQDLQRLKEFRLMDDDFLSAFFRDNIEDTEFIIETALEMIKDGQLSLEKIAQYSRLSLEKIRELAEGKSA